MDVDRNDDDLDDETVEQLLRGTYRGDDADLERLASLVGEFRTEVDTHAPAIPSAELTAIFTTGEVPGRPERPRMITPLTPMSVWRRVGARASAVMATVAGKILVGTVAVAAGIGGAHSTGAVDVPGLPDRPPPVKEDAPPVDDPPTDGGAEDGQSDDSAEHADNEPPLERIDTNAEPDPVNLPGVDGRTVSDRATSGEPTEDGRDFGQTIADEATDGTPVGERGHNRAENRQ
jgi:hypothetical protein